MKYIILIMDGAADYPIKELGNKTPLQVAKKPNIDALTTKGRCGMLITVPEDMPPDSAVANMSILGYDLRKCYQGRAVLEAANIGIKLDRYDIALRCNLISVEEDKIKDYSAGHISNEEAKQLIKLIDKKLGSKEIKFYPGVSYRHLLVLKSKKFSPDLECAPPHDFGNALVSKVLVKPKNRSAKPTADLLNRLIMESQPILENHPVNLKRRKLGKNTANSIWPWSPGRKPVMKTFQELYNIKGAVISAVDLINGLGIYAGFDVIKVKGATGLWDTNYEGKADACIKALKNNDLVYLHVEAPDEAGHAGNSKLKLRTIEDFDKRLVGRILKKVGKNVVIAILPDHATPVLVKTHVHGAVPFLIYDPRQKGDSLRKFDEESCKKGSYGLVRAKDFVSMVL